MNHVVELEAVSKTYGARCVVREVGFAIAEGERLALLGHNGAGKTTLMKMILGLTDVSGGRIGVLGGPPRASAELRRAIGFLPENVAFQENLTGWETLRFYARLKRRPAAECRDLLERVGLRDAAERRVGTYSKGMRQRLGLAQALLGEPRLLLLDEPTTGLDPELRLAFYRIVGDLAATGAAVMMSSHLLTELEERTDRIVILDRGRLVAAGSLGELRDAAGLPVRWRLRAAAGRTAELAERLDMKPPAEGGWLAFSCRPSEKMLVLQRVGELGGLVRDFDIQPPTLDEIYAWFTGGHAGVATQDRRAEMGEVRA